MLPIITKCNEKADIPF